MPYIALYVHRDKTHNPCQIFQNQNLPDETTLLRWNDAPLRLPEVGGVAVGVLGARLGAEPERKRLGNPLEKWEKHGEIVGKPTINGGF